MTTDVRFHDGQRVLVRIHDPRGRRYAGFVVRDEGPFRVIVHLDTGVRMSVHREFVEREAVR